MKRCYLKRDYEYFLEEEAYINEVHYELIAYLSNPEFAESSSEHFAGYTWAIIVDEECVYETSSHHAASAQFGVYVCPNKIFKKTSCVI